MLRLSPGLSDEFRAHIDHPFQYKVEFRVDVRTLNHQFPTLYSSKHPADPDA